MLILSSSLIFVCAFVFSYTCAFRLKFFLKPLAKANKKLKLTNYRFRLENKLRISGFRTHTSISHISDISQDEFIALKQLSAIICFGLCLYFSNFIFSFLFVILAFFLPDLWLHEVIVIRKRNIVKALPGVIDLLILLIGSGIDFVSAVDRIVKESIHGSLKDELQEFLNEVRVGKSRREALMSLSYRIGIPDVSSFVSALSQADAFGSSLIPVLRTQADQLRAKRAQRVEKLANEAPVKMLFPILLFIFPVVFIMVLSPIIIEAIQVLSYFRK